MRVRRWVKGSLLGKDTDQASHQSREICMEIVHDTVTPPLGMYVPTGLHVNTAQRYFPISTDCITSHSPKLWNQPKSPAHKTNGLPLPPT